MEEKNMAIHPTTKVIGFLAKRFVKMELKTHKKIVNFFGWTLFFSLLFEMFFVFINSNWTYYGIFWIGTFLMIICLILGMVADGRLDKLIEEEEKNPYEE